VVEYQGKKYYVCCTGCRDLFNDDPAGGLEEYRQRKAAKKPAVDGN
jgi:YHS domain-containing protein